MRRAERGIVYLDEVDDWVWMTCTMIRLNASLL